MVSSISLPTFSDEMILLYQTLNALRDAINARFSAGIGASDISWPLVAEGDLDMNENDILGGQKFWHFVNAGNYDNLADAITAAGSGGLVLIPPATTITVSGGDSISGAGVTILGSGPSSILKLTGSATSDLLAVTAGARILVSGVTFDGSSTSGGYSGLNISGGATDILIKDCWFKDFSGPALAIGPACNRILLSDCDFSGGSAEHVLITGCPVINLANLISLNAGTDAISVTSPGGAATSVIMSGITVNSATQTAISVTGDNDPGTASPVEFEGSAIYVNTTTSGAGILLGSAGVSLQRVNLSGSKVYGAGAAGISVDASRGSITGCLVDGPVGACIDLDESQHVNVTGCTLLDGTIGIDASGTTAVCKGGNNHISGCTTDVATGGEPFLQHACGDAVGSAGTTVYADVTAVSMVASSNTTGQTITIPANTLRVGSVIEFEAWGTGNGSGVARDSVVRFATKYLGFYRTQGTGNDGACHGSLVITGATTGESYSLGITTASGLTHATDMHSLTGLDLTVDNDVDVYSVSSTSDGTMKGLVLTIKHAEVS